MPRFIVPAILFGVTLVAFPFFFLRMALFLLIVGGIFRFIRRRGFGGSWSNWQSRRMEFTDRIRHMSDDEYAAFNQKHQPQRTIQVESVGRNSEGFVL